MLSIDLGLKVPRPFWLALALAYGLFFFVVFAGVTMRPNSGLEPYQEIDLSYGLLSLVVALAIAYAMRKRPRVGRILVATLIIESIFFISAPIILMPETGTSNGSTNWISYGSPSYIEYCYGGTVQVQTWPVNSWVQVVGYSPLDSCLNGIHYP